MWNGTVEDTTTVIDEWDALGWVDTMCFMNSAHSLELILKIFILEGVLMILILMNMVTIRMLTFIISVMSTSWTYSVFGYSR